MSVIKDDCRYSEDHEWARVEGTVISIGITDHAQGELGDIVFVELPELGDVLEVGDTFGTIEAVKTVADLYSPIAGEVVAINEDLIDDAANVNEDPYGKGWFIKIQIPDGEDIVDGSQLKDLMNPSEYKDFIGS